MKPRYPVVILLFFGLVFFSGTQKAMANKLKIGYIEFPPFTYTEAGGKPSGILIDLANKVFHDAGYEFEAFSYPVRRLASYIGSGDLDVWMGLKTLPEFTGKAYIGDAIIAELVLRAYTKGKKTPILVKEDLIGKSIIVLRGYSYGGWITFIEDPKNNINHIKANKHEAAFNMLKADRADFLLDYKEPSDMALQKIRINDLEYNQISALPCYFVVSRANPKGQDIIKKLEKSHEKLKKEGALNPLSTQQ
ncbi:MAG: transporter substrate-binding domain-containing protein [Proteobacteria bacterium]|nr:transporter substrate-binding domain-containing protein [Pseudomonadota bacterium]